MFWNKKNKDSNDDKKSSTEIARQDPRTKVRTTMAQTATTNTTVQNSTIFNDRARTVTYQTITQTVTHQQIAGITEIETRRTATPEELESFMATLNSQTTMKEPKSSSISRLISKYESPATADHKDKQKTTNTKPTTTKTTAQPKLQHFRTEETTVTQNRGHSYTSNLQEQRIKLNSNRGAASNKTSASAKTATDAPYTTNAARVATPLFTSTSYTSPYTRRTVSLTDAQPFSPPKNVRNPPTNPSQSTKLTPQPNNSNYTVPKDLKPIATTSYSPQNKPKSKLKPGLVYIFNNEKFDDNKNEYRVGSSVDVKALCETFEIFKLKVEVRKNPTVKEIRTVVKSIEIKDFTSRSCVVIVILSHGHRFDRVMAKNDSYSIDDDVLFPILRNPTLNGKPKVIIVQACKGSMEIGEFHKDSEQHGPPSEVLKCYSTFEGYVSYRTENGSIFIQKFCEDIKRHGHIESIDDIMKRVTKSVKIITEEKQIPTITSTMTKPLIFGDYV